MSLPPKTTKNEVLFCQRNNRLWVGCLAASSVLVLGLAFWLAHAHTKQKHADQGTLHAPTANQGSVLHPVAFTPPMSAPRVQPLPVAPTPSRGMQVAAPGGASHLQQAFNEVARTIQPTVVNINAVRSGAPVAQVAGPGGVQFANPFDGVPDKMIGNVAFESIGSGVIIDPAGYIVTNDHLVSNATAIAITRFNDPNPLPARIVATDPSRDLALLKIQSNQQFPAAPLGNSDAVTIGDWVLAVGNPFGLGHTVTAGIVSSRRSAITIGTVTYTDLLQTDAPINQGSSGGPLVDVSGQVVGINTAIYAPTGVFSGTGFAIPSNQVSAFVTKTMRGAGATAANTVQPRATVAAAPAPANTAQAWLGIHGTTVSPQMAPKLGLQRPEGVFVNVVDRNSPAADAEIRPGDVITNVASQPARSQQELAAILTALPPGLAVPVVVQSRGKTKTRRVKLGLKPPGQPVAARVVR